LLQEYDAARTRTARNTLADDRTPVLLSLSSSDGSHNLMECNRCKRELDVACFQKTLASGRIKILKMCQACRTACAQQRRANTEPEDAVIRLEQPVDHRSRVPRAFASEYWRRKSLDCGRMNIECSSCNALHWMAEKLSHSSKTAPRFGKCCKEGAVKLPPVQGPPEELRELYTSQEPSAVDFRKNIRHYNSAMSFTSLSYQVDSRTTDGFVPFQIQGQLCHLHGPLEPNTDATPAYAQVWFYDPEMANQYRMGRVNTARNAKINGPILGMLTDMLQRCNPFISIYATAREQLLALEQRLTPVEVLFTAEMRLIQEVGADHRRENLPTTSEVAAIIPDSGPGWHKRTFRDMQLRLRSPVAGQLGLEHVDPSHAAYLPLQYVLLFPHGDTGWHWDLRLQDRHREDQNVTDPPPANLAGLEDEDIEGANAADFAGQVETDIDPDFADVEQAIGGRTRDRLTMRNFHAYRMFPRRSEFNTVLRGGRLFQQYVVDAWATIDQCILKWIFHNQTEIRADLYAGNADTAAMSDVAGDRLGKRIVLPSNYIGSDRFMQAIFQDSMAIVGHYGRPSLFITFTANPQWDEIVQELYPGQTAADRPDLVARVFHMKAKMLRDELIRDGIFGQALARVWCIEYQKRGLPHMHLLLFLKNRQSYLQPEIIDQIICAEIPTDPDLAAIIKRVMIHGPCGKHDPAAPCMAKDKQTGKLQCSKRFPKDFCDKTAVKDDGYPIYQRRQSPETAYTKKIKGKDVHIDNRWVVPYNPYLSARYKAHINVEICASIHAIKYLSKYIYKGPDRTTLKLDSDVNEVNLYLQARYCGPTEGCWRIFEYRVHEEAPNVVRLTVHLPGQHSFTWKANDTTERRDERREAAKSMLMAYFEWNRDLAADAPRWRYSEMPTYCIWVKRSRRWKLRKLKREAIGRLYHCSPNQGERFYLRLLLTVKVCPISFEDLRTVDGHEHPTFKAACEAMGLLEDDREWIKTFEEAGVFMKGSALRSLFVVALLHGSVSNAKALWEQFKDVICDDLAHKLSSIDSLPETATQHSQRVWDYGLYLIAQMLQESQRAMADFGLDDPITNWGPLIMAVESADHEAAVCERLKKAASEMYMSFNEDQRGVFDKITATLYERPELAHFYLQGAGGTGKTYLYRALYADACSKGLTVLCVASSGIAAVLLPNGRTAHSQFRIPLAVDEATVCDIKLQSKLADLIRHVGLVIWDEVPMTNRLVFEAVDRTLRDVTGKEDFLFGGIPFVLGGDFAQTLPVITHGSRADIVRATLQKSYIWPKLKILTLQRNMRLQGTGVNADFATWLGSMSYDPDCIGTVELPPMVQRAFDVADLCERVFPATTLSTINADSDFFASRAILAVRNADLSAFNTPLLERMPGELRTFYSVDQAVTDDVDEGREEFTREFLQSIELSGLPPSILQLKIGAPIMLLRNLRPSEGLCNGTRLVVKGFSSHVIHARILTGDCKGNDCLIPRIQLYSLPNELPFVINRRQFPTRLCFAITVNKSQGQSLETVGVDLRSSAFSHGQLYVALSRVTDVRRLTVLLAEDRAITENVVYPEVLGDWMQ
jgi:hypothetical protein